MPAATITDFRLVRTSIRGQMLHSLRSVDSSGVETELLVSPSLENVMRIHNTVAQMLGQENGALLAQCAVAAIQSHHLAELIMTASDQQGESAYATKSHMRDWGYQITLLLMPVLAEFKYLTSDQRAA
jgi:hypothetical protein